MILEAHQGVANEYPSNTMSAFRAAKVLGYGMIELDTKFTADNECVILHDRTINRTARNADGSEIAETVNIAEITLAEACTYDFGIAKDKKYAGEKIPTLNEVLTFAKEAKISLKFDNVLWTHTPEQQKKLFEALKNSGAEVGVTFNRIEQLELLYAVYPSCPVHYDGAVNDESLAALSEAVKSPLTVWMRMDNARTHWNKTPPVTAEWSEKIHRIGKLGVWLLTESSEYQYAASVSADVIETDGSLRPNHVKF